MYEVTKGFATVTLGSQFMSRMSLIGIPATLVYIYLSTRVDVEQAWRDDLLESWPGVRDIARNMKIGKDKVLVALDKLECLGYISIRKNIHERNHYYIMPGIPDENDFHIALNNWIKDRKAKTEKRQQYREKLARSAFAVPVKQGK